MTSSEFKHFWKCGRPRRRRPSRCLRVLPAGQYETFAPDPGGRSLGELAWHLRRPTATSRTGSMLGTFAPGASRRHRRPKAVEALAPGYDGSTKTRGAGGSACAPRISIRSSDTSIRRIARSAICCGPMLPAWSAIADDRSRRRDTDRHGATWARPPARSTLYAAAAGRPRARRQPKLLPIRVRNIPRRHTTPGGPFPGPPPTAREDCASMMIGCGTACGPTTDRGPCDPSYRSI